MDVSVENTMKMVWITVKIQEHKKMNTVLVKVKQGGGDIERVE